MKQREELILMLILLAPVVLEHHELIERASEVLERIETAVEEATSSLPGQR